MTENNANVTVNTTVNTPNSRGSGSVLLFVFFWPFLLTWWTVLASLWLLWMPVAAIVNIWQSGFFAATWYQPWSVWMLGIR